MSQDDQDKHTPGADDLSALRKKYIEHVKSVYPGIRCFASMNRDPDTGITGVLFFDLEADASQPIYGLTIHPRDLLICGAGFTLPAMTFDEWNLWQETKKFPQHIPVANY